MYLIENGLRKVVPYYFPFKTSVKRRWIGKTVEEVLVGDLGQLRELVYHRIEALAIYVLANVGKRDGPTKIVGPSLASRPIMEHDVIYNSQHMHEPSVPDAPISVLHRDEHIIVVDKPSGIPTHPSGSYRRNSVTEILKHELCLADLWLCHRLDKATSGVLILGLTKEGAASVMKQIQSKEARKTYVARVTGKFPSGRAMLRCPVFLVNANGRYMNQTNIRNLPTDSATIFELWKYDETTNESVVMCEPLTGRMHQIRIHLRNLGYPIANDGVYNPVQRHGQKCSVSTSSIKNSVEQQLYDELFRHRPEFRHLQPVAPLVEGDFVDIVELCGVEEPHIQKLLEQLKQAKHAAMQQDRELHNQRCPECDKELLDTNLVPADLTIHLHALKYELGGHTYTTDMPSWAH